MKKVLNKPAIWKWSLQEKGLRIKNHHPATFASNIR